MKHTTSTRTHAASKRRLAEQATADKIEDWQFGDLRSDSDCYYGIVEWTHQSSVERQISHPDRSGLLLRDLFLTTSALILMGNVNWITLLMADRYFV
jgi:hypothetical protein